MKQRAVSTEKFMADRKFPSGFFEQFKTLDGRTGWEGNIGGQRVYLFESPVNDKDHGALLMYRIDKTVSNAWKRGHVMKSFPKWFKKKMDDWRTWANEHGFGEEDGSRQVVKIRRKTTNQMNLQGAY